MKYVVLINVPDIATALYISKQNDEIDCMDPALRFIVTNSVTSLANGIYQLSVNTHNSSENFYVLRRDDQHREGDEIHDMAFSTIADGILDYLSWTYTKLPVAIACVSKRGTIGTDPVIYVHRPWVPSLALTPLMRMSVEDGVPVCRTV